MWTVVQKFGDAIAFLHFKGYRQFKFNFLQILILGQQTSFCGLRKAQKQTQRIDKDTYYLKHSKEKCLVGLKGYEPKGTLHIKISDIIEKISGGNSEKAVEIKQLIEKMVPKGL
ncbi:MT-A70 family protein [Oxytricha trifallax]|uniref:MT-A70 family protein n=1 Tax=Oxytricha trifallax TaxID=1172189 RepID=A0A073HYU5_9SPIT|nr:MT-A70 family protein [Oxytricha trifallax]